MTDGQFIQLREAVRKLYYAAVWHADRPVDEKALWEKVRDAAGFEPGNSPKEVIVSVAEFHTTDTPPVTFPPHCGSILRIIPEPKDK